MPLQATNRPGVKAGFADTNRVQPSLGTPRIYARSHATHTNEYAAEARMIAFWNNGHAN